jgi:hypothetical protein
MNPGYNKQKSLVQSCLSEFEIQGVIDIRQDWFKSKLYDCMSKMMYIEVKMMFINVVTYNKGLS